MCVAGSVLGITQLHDVVYIICDKSSTIFSFNVTTHQRLTDIDVEDLRSPRDIVACEQMSQLYLADYKSVWRVSPDGADTKLWLPRSPSNTFRPLTLSVTSAGLLVASYNTKQLAQFDSGGDELRRVQLPRYMEPHHAVESPTGTFVVSHNNTQLRRCGIGEVSAGGKVLRQFTGSHLRSRWSSYVAVDSQGRVFVTDFDSRRTRIMLLDAQLRLRRVLVEEHQLNYKPPYRLCYREQSGQLLVAVDDKAAMFDLIHCT